MCTFWVTPTDPLRPAIRGRGCRPGIANASHVSPSVREDAPRSVGSTLIGGSAPRVHRLSPTEVFQDPGHAASQFVLFGAGQRSLVGIGRHERVSDDLARWAPVVVAGPE